MSGRRWRVEAAGIPCLIEATEEPGDWSVTMASTTIAHDTNLAAAIIQAGGGVVSVEEAETLAALVAAESETLITRR